MKIYCIAICGKGIGNLAVLLKKQGHDVRGSEFSEKTFYPPMSTYLKENYIPVDIGFHPDKITKDYDLIILGGAALIHDKNNPQVQKAKELGLNIISFARGIGDFIAEEEAIEIIGNHGKTTITSIIAWCFQKMGVDASYFIGEVPKNMQESIHKGTSRYSVVEGDEHPSLYQEKGGKFLYHKPKHVLFTSADWDHKNIYRTEKSYMRAFLELFEILPEDGSIVACMDGINVPEILTKISKNLPVYLYTLGAFKSGDTNFDFEEAINHIKDKFTKFKNKYRKLGKLVKKIYFISYLDYNYSPDETRFQVCYFDVETEEIEIIGHFITHLIGNIGVENSLASIARLHSLCFKYVQINEGIETFMGQTRRLELVYNKGYKVINDFAHSPIKIKSTLHAVRQKYKNQQIFVIFHVTQSGLKEKTTFYQLKHVFNEANFVIIPPVNPNPDAEEKFYGKDYQNLIKEGAEEDGEYLKPTNVYYTPIIHQIRSILENNLKKDDIVLIMSSGNVSEILEIVSGINLHS